MPTPNLNDPALWRSLLGHPVTLGLLTVLIVEHFIKPWLLARNAAAPKNKERWSALINTVGLLVALGVAGLTAAGLNTPFTYESFVHVLFNALQAALLAVGYYEYNKNRSGIKLL